MKGFNDNMVLCFMTFFVSLFLCIAICYILKDEKNMNKGIEITGKMLGRKMIIGTPNRYFFEIEFQYKNMIKRKKIFTADKRILGYKRDDTIPLVYVLNNDKIYWKEDNRVDKTILIILYSFGVAFSMVTFIVQLIMIIISR